MKILSTATVIVAVTLFCAQGGYGGRGEDLKALREEINTLKSGQAAMQKELETIKKQLLTRQAQPQGPAPFKEAVVSVQVGHAKGDDRAKLVLIDFSDYQ